MTNGVYIIKLWKNKSVAAVHYEDESKDSTEITDEEQKVLSFSTDESVYDGNTIYAQYDEDKSKLYKFSFIDDETVEKSVWVSEKTLNNSDVVTEKEDKNLGYTGNMNYWRLDGDYVYFIYYSGPEYFPIERNIAYRLGRIKKDGSSIELIDDEIASSYTVKDDWIYYYDNGYTYDVNLSKVDKIDSDRAGIYKMKCDGSQKKKLLDHFNEADSQNYERLCGSIEIYGEYLYFLDGTEKGKSRVCRMKTDGSDFEYVSENSAYNYTLDVDKNALYYITGKYNQSSLDSRTVYKTELNANNEEIIFEYGCYGNPDFTVYNDYLYFSNYNFGSVGDLVGLRYNLKTNEKDKLNAFYESEEIKDGRVTKHIKHGPYLNWEKAEDN